MFLKAAFALIALWTVSGCALLVPAVVGGSGSAAQFYYNERAQEVFNVEMYEAYPAAIRALTALGLVIDGIEEGPGIRTLAAHDPDIDSRHATIELENMGTKGYIKATFRASTHNILPDRAYSEMILMAFISELNVIEPSRENGINQAFLGR
jgi:hypothetical protein